MALLDFGVFASRYAQTNCLESGASGTVLGTFVNAASSYVGSMTLGGVGWTVEHVGMLSVGSIVEDVSLGSLIYLASCLGCGIPLLSQTRCYQEQLTDAQRALLYIVVVNGLCGSVPAAMGAGCFQLSPLQAGYEVASTVSGYVLIAVGVSVIDSVKNVYLYCRASDVDPETRAPLLRAPLYATVEPQDESTIRPVNNRSGRAMTVDDCVNANPPDNRDTYYQRIPSQMV